MNRSLWFCYFACFLSLAECQQALAPPRVYSAFIKQGPIVTGTIIAVLPSPQATNGTVTVDITGELRGHLAKTQLTVLFSSIPNPKYPPFAWARVPPVTGHKVLLFLAGDPDQPYAEEILDFNRGEEKWMPEVRSLLSLEAAGVSGDKKTLLDTLSNPERDLRSFAAEVLLVRVCGPADQCRIDALNKLTAIAGDANQLKVDRIWAVSLIAHSVFTGIPAAAAADRAAVTALVELLADPSVAVRDEAVQNLHGLLLGGGVAKPRVDIAPGDRAKVVQQLRRDGQSGEPFARQARELSEVLVKP